MHPSFRLCAVVLSTVFLTAAVPVASDMEKDKAFFPDSAWNPNLLKGKDTPPALLPADFDTTVPPFHSNLSIETRADLDDMLKKQAEERTPETIARIKSEDKMNWYAEWSFREDGLMPSPQEAPELHKLLEHVASNTWFFIMHEKHRFKRARPTQLEENLTTVIAVPEHASYPSGHATQGYATGLVLAKLDPAHAEEYLKLGNEIGVRREIAGVHYHSDTLAGQGMATAIVNALFDTPTIQALIPDARAELIAFREIAD
jgi:hypothetical protein